MSPNPKIVQQAIRLAVALANPTLREQDWHQIKERYQIDDDTLSGIKYLIEACSSRPELKSVLSCLTYNA